MEKQERAKLIRGLRTLIYTGDPEVVISIAKSVNPEGATGAEEAVDVIENMISNSEKEEDGGKDLLLILQKQLQGTGSPNTGTEINDIKPSTQSLKLETLKKDFKFSGQLGDTTNCIGYLSFLRQVAMATKRGYSDADVVDGVIRAIHPTARIRGYLEGRETLTLPTLQTIIRSYYKEKSSTELYQELCIITQSQKESEQEFLFRAMELRQKILFASKENTSLSYDAKLVEQQFQHTVATGLRDDTIRAEFQVVLNKYDSDESLLQSLNGITQRHQERFNKLESVPAVKAKACAVQSESTDKIIQEIKALRVQVDEIRQSRRSGDDQPKAKQRGFRLKCKQCQENNTAKCTHCFRCGSGEHYRRNCPEN